MRIIYLHQYFTTPTTRGSNVSGTRSYEFARRFVAAGHEVHMVASDWHTGAGERSGWWTENVEGINVHRLPVPYSNKMGFIARVGAFLRFAMKASTYSARLRGDVVFATSTPLTIAIPAIYATWRNRLPFVFEVRDLWPEAPRQMGELTNPVLLWLAKGLEKAAYRHAQQIVALSPGMKDGIVAAGESAEKVTMIPNSCDLDLFRPDINGIDVRARLGLGDRLALMYFGTMGPANGLDFVLDAAAELKRRGETRAVLVLHGDGKMRGHLENRRIAENLDNVVFSAPLPDKALVARLIAAADVGMTIYRNLPVLHTCSPNKMFDTLAAGRPVLTNMPGWLTDTVQSNQCGVGVRPDNPGDFADKVQWLLANRERLPEMGRNARALAERTFSRDVLAANLLALLEQVAGVPRANPYASVAPKS